MRPTIKPFKNQHLAWEKLKDKETEFILYGGAAGGGKSWLGCEWLLTSAFFYPGTRYFMARQELKDLRESTYQSFLKVCSHHKIKTDSLFRYNGQDNFFQFHNGSRIDMVDLAPKPRDPFFERLGSVEFTSGWIEEAGEVTEGAFNIISSRTNRHYNDKYGLLGKTFLTCNPKKNFLYTEFYKPWKKGTLDKNKAFIQAFVDDNIYGESQYKKKLENLKGVARQRLLMGEWEYDDSPEALIDYDKILDVFLNQHMRGNPYYLTVDVARKGKDTTIIGLWKGWAVTLYQYKGLLTTETSKKVKELQEKYLISTSNIIIDEDGVGGGCVDQVGCQGFMNGSSALPNPENPQRDEKGNIVPENYENLRSQCYFRMARRINNGGMFIESHNLEDKQKEEIIEELEWVKQKDVELVTVGDLDVVMTGDKKKLGIISRDDIKAGIGRSPDWASTLMMREYFELRPKFIIAAY